CFADATSLSHWHLHKFQSCSSACGAGDSLKPRVERGSAEPWVAIEKNLQAHSVGGRVDHPKCSVAHPKINGCRPLRGLDGRLPFPQGSALPRSTMGSTLPSASRTEICVDTNDASSWHLQQACLIRLSATVCFHFPFAI